MFWCFSLLLFNLGLCSQLLAEEIKLQVMNDAPGVLNLQEVPFVRIGNGNYFIETNKKTWFEAFASCRRMDSYLISFETMDEWYLVNQYLKDKDLADTGGFWSSGSDLEHQGYHKWFSTGRSITLNIWTPGEPNNFGGNEHCDVFYVMGTPSPNVMNDVNCLNHIGFICEIPATKTASYCS